MLHTVHVFAMSLTDRVMRAYQRVRYIRRDRARDRVLEYLGDAAKLTDEDRARIDAEWR